MNWISSDSKAIAAYAYDEARQELHVEWTGGARKTYSEFTPVHFRAFENAESKGAHLNTHIKPNHPCRDFQEVS